MNLMGITTLKRDCFERQEVYCLSGFGRPFGLNQDRKGYFYITDMDLHTVFRISPNLSSSSWLHPQQGGWMTEQPIEEGLRLAAKPQKPSLLNGPHAIEFDRNDNFYVTTYYQPLISVFNADGVFRFDIGNQKSTHPLKGPATAFFNRSEDCLLVSEYAENAILRYSRTGDYLGGLGWQMQEDEASERFKQDCEFVASSKPGGFDRLHMVKESREGYLYCADSWNHRIQKFSAAGNFESLFTHKLLNCPVSVSFTAENDLIVTSWGNNTILFFDERGKLKSQITDLNLKKPYDAQFFSPWLVIADSHNGRVLFVNAGVSYHD